MEHDEIVRRFKKATKEIFILGREASRYENSIVLSLMNIAAEHFVELIDELYHDFMGDEEDD